MGILPPSASVRWPISIGLVALIVTPPCTQVGQGHGISLRVSSYTRLALLS